MAVNEKLVSLAQEKMFVYADPKDAIKAAAKELNVKLSATEEQEILSSLNGNANWGKFDIFKKPEDFNPAKASEYKQLAQEKAKTKKPGVKFRPPQSRKEMAVAVGGGLVAAAGVAALIASGPAGWAVAAALIGGGMVVSSCGEKHEEIARIDTKVFNNATVAINIPMKDYTGDIQAIRNEIKGLRGDLSKLEKEAADAYLGILDKFDAILAKLKNHEDITQKYFNDLIADIAAWMKKVTENQIKINTDNNTNFETLFDLIKKIVDNTTLDANAKFQKLLDLLTQIKSIGESIDAKMDVVIDLLKKSLGNDEVIIAKLDKLDKNDEKIYAALVAIQNAIAKYGDAGISLGKSIINAIQGNKVDLSGIEALLKQLNVKQAQTNDQINTLTALFNKFGADVNAKLNTIIAKIKDAPDYTAKLNTIIDLLGKMDANNEVRNQKVLDAIAKLGVDVTANLTAIYNKIGKGGQEGKDYSAILDAILKKLGEIKADNNNNFAAILKAIGSINIKPQDLTWIKAHLDAILEAIKNHDVVVKVEGGKCCCCHQDGTPVHEGVLYDLSELLG